jgi:hypothetical protein
MLVSPTLRKVAEPMSSGLSPSKFIRIGFQHTIRKVDMETPKTTSLLKHLTCIPHNLSYLCRGLWPFGEDPQTDILHVGNRGADPGFDKAGEASGTEGGELEVVGGEEEVVGFFSDGFGYLVQDEEVFDTVPVAAVGASKGIEC